MSTFRHWKVAAALGLLALCSAAAGALLGHRIARREFETRNNPENWNARAGREFDRLVKPDPAQAARIQARLDVAVGELQVIRSETIRRSTNVIWRLIEGVETELTPEQRRAFDRMKPAPADLTLDLLNVEAHPAGKTPAAP